MEAALLYNILGETRRIIVWGEKSIVNVCTELAEDSAEVSYL